MKYKLIQSSNGVPAGFVADATGHLTLEQAQNAVLCGKENPTETDIANAKQANQEYLASTAYIKNRRQEYPPITDYIDGVVKGDQAQIDAYIAACLAVKAKYPKV